MKVRTQSSLACFNCLVLNYQDEAYTLAWYLFGSDERANEAVQTAVRRLYRDTPTDEAQFRTRLLHLVWQQGKNQPIRLPAEAGYHLQTLSRRQAQLLLLVAVLRLDYQQAAEVVGGSERAVSREIAAARQTMVFPLAAYAPQPERNPLS